MKAALLGFSGSGKSTLAKRLSIHYGIKALHLDSVHWLSDWRERDAKEGRAIAENFLAENDSWVIDGNYSRYAYEKRLAQADLIIILLFNRFECLRRVLKRYRRYKNTVRADMGEGCKEKVDWEFIRWVLFDGRSRNRKKAFYNIAKANKDKTVIFKNQRALDKWLKANNIGNEKIDL